MKLAHAYHVFAGGAWREPVAEHLAALDASGFDGPFTVGLVGDEDQCREALHEIRALRRPGRTIQAREGFEQTTLRAVRRWARTHDGAVMYAHTKGAGNPSAFQDAWRRSMTWHVVRCWGHALERLDGHDAVGCHWLTAEQFPTSNAATPLPMFGGNFWIATCEYVRRLPACGTTSRHDAEAWIGLGDPDVIDLFPGWPGSVPFPRIPAPQLIAGRS